MKALLALESGRVFEGVSFGSEGETSGEVVFNTSMSGYQEIITDPSYEGQIITMTSVHIGNYGVNQADAESRKPFGAGMVVREISQVHSNWRADESVQTYFQRYGLVGIAGVDTRSLTRHLRETGSLRGVISTTDLNPQTLIEKAKKSTPMVGADLAGKVSCEKPYEWVREGTSWSRKPIEMGKPSPKASNQKRVIVMDFGIKFNTLRSLAIRNCQVIVMPAQSSATEILAMEPEGIMVSNGPGDPSAVKYGIKALNELVQHLQKQPREKQFSIMGICLGQQLLAHAFGGKTFKLKFGHRGGNHPVKDLTTGKIEITSQNHGFAVDPASLPKELEVTHTNLNDQTCEGFRHKTLPIFSVQYHPEASPGPHDADYLFDRFIQLIQTKGVTANA